MELLIGAILGGLVSWLITDIYYKRQLKDAKDSERRLQNNFDHLAHLSRQAEAKRQEDADMLATLMHYAGVDIRGVMDAISVGDEEKLSRAFDAILPDLNAQVRKDVLISSLLEIPVVNNVTKEQLLEAYRRHKSAPQGTMWRNP